MAKLSMYASKHGRNEIWFNSSQLSNANIQRGMNKLLDDSLANILTGCLVVCKPYTHTVRISQKLET